MNIFHWLAGRFNRRKGLSLYKRGMAKAKKHQYKGAIDDYTMAINMLDTPADVKAMALYNRALVYVVNGDNQKGTADLNMVLMMKEQLVNIKTMARQKLARMESRSRKSTV